MPFVTYLFLTGQGMGTVPALALGGLWNGPGLHGR